MFEIAVAVRSPRDLSRAGYDADMTLRAADVAAQVRASFGGMLPVMKLHKLLYYCQGHHVAATGKALFSDTVSAWDMGPVVGSLWHDEQEEGPATTGAVLDEAALNTIGYVISRYGRLSGADLQHLSHSEYPWLRANENRRPGESARIELDWLRQHFSHDADEDEAPAFDSTVVTQWIAETTAEPIDEPAADRYEEVAARLAHARR